MTTSLLSTMLDRLVRSNLSEADARKVLDSYMASVLSHPVRNHWFSSLRELGPIAVYGVWTGVRLEAVLVLADRYTDHPAMALLARDVYDFPSAL